MRKLKRIKNLDKKVILILAIIIIIGIFATTIYATYSILLYKTIENTIRHLGIITLFNALAVVLILTYKFWKKNCLKVFSIFFVIVSIYMGVVFYSGNKLSSIYTNIKNITEGDTRLFSSSIVVKYDSPYKDIEDAKKGTIGVMGEEHLDEEQRIQGCAIPNMVFEEEKFDKKKIIIYDSYTELVIDLLDGKIDSAFLPSGYVLMFSSIEQFEEIENETRIIHTKTVEKVVENELVEQKDLSEPFTILVMGVDQEGEGLPATFNGDALMLLTFNPNTLNTTVISIPRDSYVPISCMGNRKNKITHAGWGGDNCFIRTIGNLFDVKIDYYFKINFAGVVSFIDAIGGVEIEVPYSFCEQNSNREWGKNTVFVEEGLNLLNGEQALAFMRHRKKTPYMNSYCGSKYVQNASYWNDFTRGVNQQTVLTAVMNKLANEVNSFSTIETLLNTISNNSKTNMSTETIFSLYNLGKDSLKKINTTSKVFSMQRLHLSGHDAMIYDYSYLHNKGNRLVLYNFALYDDSLAAVIEAMKINLGLKPVNPVKSFSFSIKNEYEATVIGKGKYSKTSLVLMPNLVGRDVIYAQSIADTYNLTLVINYVEGVSGQFIGQVTSQSIHASTDMDYIPADRVLTINVINKIIVIEEPDPDEGEDDDFINIFGI